MPTTHLPRLGLSGIADLLDNKSALALICEDAPYIARLVNRHGEILETVRSRGVEAAFDLALAQVAQAREQAEDREGVCHLLRRAKEMGHLAIALADLSGTWTTNQVIRAITVLAEECCGAALWCAYAQAVKKGWVAEQAGLEDTGLFAIAMGKMGAYELNYSSDVDVIILFDPQRLKALSRSAKEAAVRITQDFVAIMETRDGDGYVFRVDLRLRPDPSSNAVALSSDTALDYYERIGQNWERMAYIKARACAGDLTAAKRFMDELEPFIWRRHLDYWAIGDIHAIKRQIHAKGGHEAVEVAEFDVKLGRGGIREIEFFAQTQQLILGGRDPSLRTRRTDEALDALVKVDAVQAQTAADLKRAYDFLRALEHRIQMRNDEQTHMLPDGEEARARIARLCGYGDDTARFEQDVSTVRIYVHGVYSDLFAQEERLSGETGNLVFTGVDDDPGTVKTLQEMGFSNPSHIIETIRRWHRGGLPATRSARGRQLLTSLTPRLLTWMSQTGEPDAALARFSDFLSGLRSGVQVFALMLAEPLFAEDLIAVMAYAPKLAGDLARQPALLDGMLDRDFNTPLADDPPTRVLSVLKEAVLDAGDFEEKLNIGRRIHREEALRIGYQILRGQADASVAGTAYTQLADACVEVMAEAALAEVERKFGAWPGKWAICAMGKLGGRELSATSDLDIMVIYDPGASPAPEDLAPRFTQRLIAALSAPTEEGAMYEVDMQLRPSGGAGPVAVKLSAFERYYEGDAWTWEFMALTRLRVVTGDETLAARIGGIAREAIMRRSGFEGLKADILDMRQRLARERKPHSIWDVKLAEGGLLDAEFIVQQEILKGAAEAPQIMRANMVEAISELARAGRLTTEEADALSEGYGLQASVQQALRIATQGRFNPDAASSGLKRWLARTCGVEGFSELEQRVVSCQANIAAIRLQKIGALTTDR